MGLMNERATDQMGCAHPWPVLVDLCVRERATGKERRKLFTPQIPFSLAFIKIHTVGSFVPSLFHYHLFLHSACCLNSVKSVWEVLIAIININFAF